MVMKNEAENVTKREWQQAQRLHLTTTKDGQRWMIRGEAVIGGMRFVPVRVEGMKEVTA